MFAHFDKIAPKSLLSHRCLLCGCEFRPAKSSESICEKCSVGDERCIHCKAREAFCSECQARETFFKLTAFSGALSAQPIRKFM